MPVITALHPTRRRPGYVDVEVDGVLLGAVSERDAAALGLAPGSEMDDDAVSRLRAQADLARALAIANGYLGHRPRSEAEVRTRLRQAQIDAKTVDAAIERLRAQGLLDDRRFAALWVESRASFSPRSSRALANELRQKGVDREQIDEVLERSGQDDLRAALEAGRARLRALQSADEVEFRRRLSGFLARRGFSYDVAREAVDTLWGER